MFCETHNKRIEAFCDFEKKVLCIDCILNDNHKNHTILSIDKAQEKEKFSFKMSLSQAVNKESDI